MRTRKLGSTGLRVSEIGFGAWGIGGNAGGAIAYGPTDDAQSIRALQAACERGINFFDTADLYGFGHSETVLGRALAGRRRGEVVLASKVGMVDADGRLDFSPAHLREALHRTLERLRTDYLDLYQLHGAPLEMLRRDSGPLEALEAFRREGKIRAFGLSARSPDEALAAVRELGLACLQVNFNLVDQRARENGLFALCAERNVGVIVRTPLCFGFLAGKVDAATVFDPADHRNRWSAEQRQRWADAVRLFFAGLGDRERQTPAQLALRFCLSFPAVSSVIPGMLTTAEVEENTRASDIGPLAPDDLDRFAGIYRSGEFFVPR